MILSFFLAFSLSIFQSFRPIGSIGKRLFLLGETLNIHKGISVSILLSIFNNFLVIYAINYLLFACPIYFK